MKRIFFFATPADIGPVLTRWEATSPLTFVPTRTLSRPDRTVFKRAADLPSPGVASHETGSLSESYLVMPRGATPRQRQGKTREGGAWWGIHNGDNEESVVFTAAGLWGDVLLPGQVNTVHDSVPAQALMKGFAAALRKEGFRKFGLWSLGPEALTLYRAGRRLTTTAAQSPPEFDLKLPETT
ncbi:MAG: hypothetical protein GC145_01555 [Caulobacter sp.]|nr:hypothetical protein [Caulobacter sp.]